MAVLGIAGVCAQTNVTVDGTTRHQTISGWEAVTFSSQDDAAFANFKEELFDRVINEAGINRVRLEVRSGAENSRDYFGEYQAGQVDYTTWRANRYATVNDNGDTNSINLAGFHFTELDANIRKIVIPLRDRAAGKGERLYINLNYVAFTAQITAGGSYHHANPDEYAEFILAVFEHVQREFGFVPDAVEILLEPDNVSQWNGTIIGRTIVAVKARLSGAGFDPEIIAPSCTNMGNAVTYFDALAAVPGAVGALDEICYHRYGGVSDANLQAIASRAVQRGKRTSMLEWWSTGNGIDVLLKDLTMGRNSAWQQGVLAGIGALDDDMALYKVDVTNPSAPVVRINRKTRLMRQVYRFVRRGAVRIGAAVGTGPLQPIAFINADGGYVVVIRATAASDIRVNGLPAGVYGINYSTATEFNVSRPEQTIGPGGAISTRIPANGALTVYQLQPKVSASMATGSVELTVNHLKPGFIGAIERKTDLSSSTGWQEIGAIGPADLTAKWTGAAGADAEYFRFRQK